MSFSGWGGGSGGAGGAGPSTPFRPASHSAFRANAAASSSRPPCKFWAAGTCNRGDKCDFSHTAPRGAARGGGANASGGGWGASNVWGGGGAAVLTPSNPFQSATASAFNTFTSPPSLPPGQSAFGAQSQPSNPFAASAPPSSAFGPLTTPNPFSSLAQPGLGSGSAFAQPFGGGGGQSLVPANPFAAAAPAFAQQQPMQQPQSLLFPSPPSNPFQQSSLSNPFQSPLSAFGPSAASAFPSSTPASSSLPSAASPLPCGSASLQQCVEHYRLDMQQLLYPFTCYSHDNCAGVCITGDVSYEEWRWDITQASAQGQLNGARQRWEQRRQEAMAVRGWLLIKPELLHRDVTGWTWEQLVGDMRAAGVGEGLGAAQAMSTGMSVSAAQAPAAQPFGAPSPFAAPLTTAASAGAMESSTVTAGASAPFAGLGIAAGPPGGAVVTTTGQPMASAAAAAPAPARSLPAPSVSPAMSAEEEKAAWLAPAFQWGRIPETPPPIRPV